MTQNQTPMNNISQQHLDENRSEYELTESFHRMTDVLKCKWMLAITQGLRSGHHRPSELQRALPGLTSKVLTDRLKRLESYGLVDRQVFAEVPPRVEYTLTPQGQELVEILIPLTDFIVRWK